ncbi:hypothetical protein BC629DRAFT_1441501 [Irpex lacteus]|nr:hypothetical protein BC629DRAFT_1441501 [Irpex lacteus]
MSTNIPTASQPMPTTPKTPLPDSSTTSGSPSPLSYRRRSPPLPKLNLDDCKPIIETTTTNTSSNAAYKPSTAFVFTSSRTLRNLHNYRSPRSEPTLLPPAEISRSPTHEERVSSGAVIGSEASQKQSRDKPMLLPEQLARHSCGALDARCVVSANMRAAGFVPLTHATPSTPSTPMVATVPTPKDPPRFPPVVFVNHPHTTTVPMWDYQRRLVYGLGQGPSINLGYPTADVSSRTSAADVNFSSTSPATVQNMPRDPEVELPPNTTFGSVSASNSNESMISQSASSIFSVASQTSSAPSSLPTSPRSISESHVLKPLHERFEQFSQQENGTLSVYKNDLPGIDGYPFPRQRESSALASRPASLAFPQSPALGTASPAQSYTTLSGSATPLAQSPLGPPSVQPSLPLHPQGDSESVTNPPRPEAKPIQYKPPSFKSKAVQERERKQKLREEKLAARMAAASLTELCSELPTWYANPLLPPSSSSSGTGSSSPLVASSSGSSSGRSSALRRRAMSTTSTTAGSVNSNFGLKVKDATPLSSALVTEEMEQERLRAEIAEDSGETVAAEKPEPAVVVEKAKDEDTGSEKSGRRGRRSDREKDREVERAKRRERRRLKGKMKEADLSAVDRTSTHSPSLSSSVTSSENSSVRSNPSTKSKKNKGCAAVVTTIFPPKEVVLASDRVHVLGSYDPVLTKERKRDAGEAVKDEVLAHRERDREHARLTNQWSLSDDETRSSQKKHTPKPKLKAMTLEDMVSVHSRASAFEGNHRGRGRGRGERPSMRGRSTSSTVSVLSDGETVVGDTGPAQITSVIDE